MKLNNRQLGGLQARDTNKSLYGPDFYKRIGSLGGKKGKADGVIKGFALDKEWAKIAGKRGGLNSRRGKAKPSKRSKK